MKKSSFLLFSFMFFVEQLLADQTYVCTSGNGQQERIIKVIYQDQASKVPCDVSYQSDGKEQILFQAQDRHGFCEKKALEFVQHQLNQGWACGDVTPLLEVMPEALEVYSPEQVADYKQAALFTQAVSVISPFKMMLTEFYYMEGEYPDSLQQIGLKPEDMNTSSHISDLTIGANGEIYAQGNEELGLDTIIMLKPKLALGGFSREWECITNIKLKDINFCEYNSQLVFPVINDNKVTQ